MTDMLSGRLLVEKTFTYMSAVTKECRKFLSTQFSQKHKGIPFDSVETILKQEIESWFARRDKNIAVNFEKSAHGRPGELPRNLFRGN